MSVEQKRKAIADAYPGWTKVQSMPEKQVHVIYMRLLNQNKL